LEFEPHPPCEIAPQGDISFRYTRRGFQEATTMPKCNTLIPPAGSVAADKRSSRKSAPHMIMSEIRPAEAAPPKHRRLTWIRPLPLEPGTCSPTPLDWKCRSRPAVLRSPAGSRTKAASTSRSAIFPGIREAAGWSFVGMGRVSFSGIDSA
jgi:hypothetical protein